MMVFESNNKRPATEEEIPRQLDLKKQRLDDSFDKEDGDFSSTMYSKFIKNALDELEKVCVIKTKNIRHYVL